MENNQISEFREGSCKTLDELNEKLLIELEKAFGPKAGATDLQLIAEFELD
jgi:hypothetical protein